MPRIISILNDLTPDFRRQIKETGYLDVEAIHPDNVVTAFDDTHFHIEDWFQVAILINVAHLKLKYKTIVLTNERRLFKCRKTTNQLMRHLKDQFPINHHADQKTYAHALSIKAHVPYVCGDFWLIPMTKKKSANRTWFRWDFPEWETYRNQVGRKCVDINIKAFPRLRFPTTRKAFKNRVKKAKLIASYLRTLCSLINPKYTAAGLLHLSPQRFKFVNNRVKKFERKQVTTKLLGAKHDPLIHEAAHNELEKGSMYQLPELEGFTYDYLDLEA